MANCQPHDKSVQQNPTRTASLVASQPFLDARRGVAVLCHPRFNLCSSARCCGAATLGGALGNDAVYLVSVSVLVRSWGSASYSWPLSAERAGVSEPSAVFACSCQRPSGSKKKKKKIVRVWIHRCPTHYAHVSHAVAPIRSGERAPVLKFQAPPSLCRPQAATARACLPVPVPGAQQYVPILPGNTSLTFVSSSGLSSKVLPVRLAIATRPPMEVS